MKNSKEMKKKASVTTTPLDPDHAQQVPVLTPEGKSANRETIEEEPPKAHQHKITPKQPLYEDKTETYHLKKKK